jgi:hypothetical protein
MNVGTTAQGLDLVQILTGESGKFIALPPEGGTFGIECQNGTITSLQYLTVGVSATLTPVLGLWNVRKIAQLGDDTPISRLAQQQLQQTQQQPGYTGHAPQPYQQPQHAGDPQPNWRP